MRRRYLAPPWRSRWRRHSEWSRSTAGAGTTRTYVVLYKQLAVTGDAAARVQAAGGTLVASYPQIGVTIARSSNDGFAAR